MRLRESRMLVLVVVLLVGFGLIYAAKTCPQCGTSNPDNAKFCKSCGYRFPAPTPQPRPTPTLDVDVSVEAGAVRIESRPSGATVLIDGEREETTPVVFSDLSPGRHRLTVRRGGYRTYQGSFIIPELAGTIAVTTVPAGATILLDGQVKGVAGEEGLVLTGIVQGTHRVTARLTGHADETRTVELSAARPAGALSIRLRMIEGFLRVESDPVRAAIFVDNKEVGTSPFTANLDAGTYRLRATLSGYNDWNGIAEVAVAETSFVLARLRRLHPRRPGYLWGGVAGLAVGAVGAVVGEISYAGYRKATTADEAVQLRQQTQVWDWVRNAGVGLGALGVGAYFVIRGS